MVVRVVQWTVDVEDVDLMARFWSGALGYTVEKGEDGSAKLFPPPHRSAEAPTVWLQASGTPKHGKNRLHLDVVSDGGAQAEVQRLIRLGARPTDVGQTDRRRQGCSLNGAPWRDLPEPVGAVETWTMAAAVDR
jgi:hypothetical protein